MKCRRARTEGGLPSGGAVLPDRFDAQRSWALRTPAATTMGVITINKIQANKQYLAHRSSASLYTATRRPRSSGELTGRPSCSTRGLGGRKKKTAPASQSKGHARARQRAVRFASEWERGASDEGRDGEGRGEVAGEGGG